MKRVISLCLFLAGVSCVSASDFTDTVELEEDEGTRVPSNEHLGAFGTPSGEQAYVACAEDKPGVFLTIANVPTGKWPESFCRNPIAQAFLGLGYGVFATRQSGYQDRSVLPDYGGKAARGELIAAMKTFATIFKKNPEPAAYWAYGEASIGLLFYLKSHPTKAAVIIGGGIYDMEETLRLTNSAKVKKDLAQLAEKEGESSLETRSIAWDPGGLPPNIYIYHSENDDIFPLAGAKAFRDTLSAQGYQVSLSTLPELGHKLDDKVHGTALKKLLIDHVATPKSGQRRNGE